MKEAKVKEINFGISDGMKDFLNGLIDRACKEANEKMSMENNSRKIGCEVKETIAEIAKKEIEKIKKELEKNPNDDDWNNLIQKLDKVGDLIRFY